MRSLLVFSSEVIPLVLFRKMITLLLLSFFSLSQADNFDQAYSDLENYRTIYISENGPRLSVVTEQAKVVSRRGGQRNTAMLVPEGPLICTKSQTEDQMD
ncbi:hypothetical protein MHYP_G00186520 [Metynnis hypsauchen]